MTRLAFVITLAAVLAAHAPADAAPTIEPIQNAPLSGMITFPSAAVQDTVFIPYAIPVSREELLAGPPRPVVYFLHGYIREEGAGVFDPISRVRSASKAIEGKGAIGNQYIPHIKALAASLDAIIIFVNGGSCFYRNSIDPDGPRYEDHIIEELIPFVEEQFNAISSRDGRAITGHSMGAMGAAYLGLKYQTLFGAIGCRSGSYDLGQGVVTADDFPRDVEWDTRIATFGPTMDYASFVANAPVMMAEKLEDPTPAIFLDVGIHDESMYPSTLRFHQKLLELDIPHVYRVTPDGHGWVPYIMEQIQWSVQVLRRMRSMDDLRQLYPVSFEQYRVPAPANQ